MAVNYLTLRSTLLYNTQGGSALPTGYLNIVSTGGTAWTNNVSLNATTFSTLTGSTITSVSSIGIGTAAPSVKLQIIGTPSGGTLSAHNDVEWGDFSNTTYSAMGALGTSQTSYGSGAMYLYQNGNTSTPAVKIAAGSADYTYFNGGGYVGIGTATPQGTLDVYGMLYVGKGTNVGGQGVYINTGWIGTDPNEYAPFQVAVRNTKYFVVNTNGYVGIGTATPGATLHIYAASAPGLSIGNSTYPNDFQINMAYGVGYFSASAIVGDSIIRTTSGNLMLQVGSGAAAIYLSKTNNYVGIGTNAPSFFFTVNGPQWPDASLAITNNTNTNCQIVMGSYWSGTLSSSYSCIQATTGGVGNQSLMIQQYGNVGIGITNPSYKLDVSGSVRLSGILGFSPAGTTLNVMYYWWTSSQFAFSVDNAAFYYVSPNSDYRIKENIQVPGSILNRLCAINMIDYEFKTQGTIKNDGKRLGVFAHELQEAFPEYPNIVIGAKDGVNADGSIKIQSIAGEAVGYLVMKSVQELASQNAQLTTSLSVISQTVQEQQQTITTLEAQMATLLAWARTQGFQA